MITWAIVALGATPTAPRHAARAPVRVSHAEADTRRLHSTRRTREAHSNRAACQGRERAEERGWNPRQEQERQEQERQEQERQEQERQEQERQEQERQEQERQERRIRARMVLCHAALPCAACGMLWQRLAGSGEAARAAGAGHRGQTDEWLELAHARTARGGFGATAQQQRARCSTQHRGRGVGVGRAGAAYARMAQPPPRSRPLTDARIRSPRRAHRARGPGYSRVVARMHG